MELAKKLFKGDFKIWIIFLLLVGISITEGYSAMSTLAYKQEYFWMPIWRHITFLMTGMVVMTLMAQLHYQKIGKALLVLYPIALGMLVITPIMGLEVNGAHRWIFGLQPSEIGKLAVIGYLAFVLSRERLDDKQRFWMSVVGASIICILIFPENFSTCGLLFMISYLVMFIARMPLKYMAILAGVGLLLVAILFIFLLSCPNEKLENNGRLLTWKSRIVEFVDSKESENVDEEITKGLYDDKYQVIQAKIAIAHGGVFGQFPGHGRQREFLPQAFSDFIYAIIIEEMGLIGGIFVLGLYITLLIRVGIIAKKCKSNYPKYLLLGSVLLIVVQALINMAVAVGLMPVTGQPLPLISRGGTSVIITCVYFGIILSVSQSLKEQKQAEVEEVIKENEMMVDNMTATEASENTEETKAITVGQEQLKN